MSVWREDLMHILLTSKHQPDFIRAIIKFAEQLEFDYFAYGMCVTLHVTQPKFRILNNYPKNWQALYGERGYLTQDPSVQYCLETTRPLVWNDSLFTCARDFWEEAKAHGIRSGWSQSVQLNRIAKGMFTLARSQDPLTPEELISKLPSMVWLNQTVQAGFQQFLLPTLLPGIQPALTNREVEVLKWCAEGKTSFEIGLILSIAERTVSFHMANALEKLNATNKTAAVLRAYQLGFI